MVASIWLQPTGKQQEFLRGVIARLAAKYGTAPFQPHLTVCSARDVGPAKTEAAADYIRRSGLLPLAARKVGISYSTTTPLRAVVIDLENSGELTSLRRALQRIIGAAELQPPHISLLYTIDEDGQRTGWWSDGTKLQAIADECAAQVAITEFVLDQPVIIAPDGDWTNIRSWKIVRTI
jgi:hypothetical protein